MPPKVRRPAAAPKGLPLVRPRGRKRPARAEEEDPEEEEALLQCSALTLEQCRGLREVEVVSGAYWEGPAQAALKVQEVTMMKEGELYLRGAVLGTKSEALLRAASERPGRVIEVHLCSERCTGGPHTEGGDACPHSQAPRHQERSVDEQHGTRASERRCGGRDGGDEGRSGPATGAPGPAKGSRGRGGASYGLLGREEGIKKEERQKPPEETQRMEGRRAERSEGDLSVYRSRPRSRSAQALPSPSGPYCQEEGQRCIGQQHGEQQQFVECGAGRPGALWGVREGPAHRQEIAGDAGGHRRGRDCGKPRDPRGGVMGGSLRLLTPSLCPVLQDPPHGTDESCHGKRVSHALPCNGLDATRQGGREPGFVLSAPEITRNGVQWHPLHSGSTTGVAAPRRDDDLHNSRVQGSSPLGPGRRPSNGRGRPALRQSEYLLWEDRGVDQGRWQEGRSKRQRREVREQKERGRQGRRAQRQRELEETPIQAEERQFAERQSEAVRSRQLAPGEAKDERVSEGSCRPLDGLQRQQGSETPRGEDNSSFWGPTPDCKRLDQGLHGFHADEKGGHAQAALTMNARQPPKSDDACVAGSKQPAAEISGTEGTLTGSESFAGRRFSELGGPLFESLQKYSWTRHSKTQTMAKDALFPLPLGGYPEVPPLFAPWMRAILLGLNSMAGSETGSADSPTEAQKRLVRGLLPFLERVCQFEEQIPSTGFSELFRVKGVDYRGEEIKLATSFNWESIAGALPQEVGSLELAAFCSGGCRHYVDHFEDFLLPPGQQTIGRTPRVLVAPDDWFGVCEGLINTGICGVLPRDQLHHVGDQVLLNGLFAVSKNEFTASGLELQRLIMNLVPLSQLCRSLRGDVGTLPTIAGLSAFYLEDHEVAVMSSEDVKCFYYLFKIPLSWRRFMGFAREVPCDLVPETYKGQPCHLVAQVLPMGFINSVGLAQHIHRNVVRWSRAGLEQLGGGEQELRRDRPAPHSQTLFRVYLDNWDEVRKVDKALCLEVEGKPSVHQLALRQQYSDLELPRHPKKAVESSCVAEVQGALLDGENWGGICKAS